VADWDSPDLRLIGVEMRAGGSTDPGAAYAVFNSGGAADIRLPQGRWSWVLDSANPAHVSAECSGALAISGQSVQLFKSVGSADPVR
jgi:hypothetical protein